MCKEEESKTDKVPIKKFPQLSHKLGMHNCIYKGHSEYFSALFLFSKNNTLHTVVKAKHCVFD